MIENVAVTFWVLLSVATFIGVGVIVLRTGSSKILLYKGLMNSKWFIIGIAVLALIYIGVGAVAYLNEPRSPNIPSGQHSPNIESAPISPWPSPCTINNFNSKC